MSIKKIISPNHESLIHMEAALVSWILNCRKKNIALDRKATQSKAINLYELYKYKETDEKIRTKMKTK